MALRDTRSLIANGGFLRAATLAGMRGSGLTIGELTTLKQIERKGFRVELVKKREGEWCCQVGNSQGAACYRGPTPSEAIRLTADGVYREELRRKVLGE